MNKLIKRASKVTLTAGALASMQAYAALPVGVTTAITDAQADGETLGYALLSMAVVVGVIFWLKRKA